MLYESYLKQHATERLLSTKETKHALDVSFGNQTDFQRPLEYIYIRRYADKPQQTDTQQSM